jgi:hypothetical protein
LLDGLVAGVGFAGDGDLADPAVCGGRGDEGQREENGGEGFHGGRRRRDEGGRKEGKKDEALLLHGRNYPTAFIWYLCLHAVVAIVGFPHQA